MAFNPSSSFVMPLTEGFDASTAGMSAFDPGKNAALTMELAGNALDARARFKSVKEYSEALGRAQEYSSRGSGIGGTLLKAGMSFLNPIAGKVGDKFADAIFKS